MKFLSNISGYRGEIIFNTDMPDGAKRKLLDSSIIKKLGWKPSISLEDGLQRTYKWFSDNQSSFRNN
mgnify:FL=1